MGLTVRVVLDKLENVAEHKIIPDVFGFGRCLTKVRLCLRPPAQSVQLQLARDNDVCEIYLNGMQ